MRIDHCDNIIHFTKGVNKEAAYQKLKAIIKSGELRTGNGMILGNKYCVCFTEAPVHCLTVQNKLNPKYFSRYKPFGFQFTKKTIFNYGGRPVIYSLRREYEVNKLNPMLNWRFASYDPNQDGKLDFTWEREWRTNKNIPLDPCEVKLVFPSISWVNRFIEEHEKEYHGLSEDDDCVECFCSREATVISYEDFMAPEKCEILSGTCPDSTKFPWVLINMNEQEPNQRIPRIAITID